MVFEDLQLENDDIVLCFYETNHKKYVTKSIASNQHGSIHRLSYLLKFWPWGAGGGRGSCCGSLDQIKAI